MKTNKLAIKGGLQTREKPWPKWPSADRDTERILIDVLHSGRWTLSGYYSGTGCYERKFSQAFADYCGTKYCTPVSNGSAALLTAFQALDVGPGCEVLVPAITWVACASTVLSVGACPVFVDIDKSSLCMDPDKAKELITSSTKAIVIVHAYCSIADIDSFVSISQDAGIPLIEDCSQAHGSIWNGRRVGGFGTIGVFSMQHSKVLTSGEGGAIVLNDEYLYKKCEQLRADGRLFQDNKSAQIGFMEIYDVGDVIGQNRCLSEFHSALLLDRLKNLDKEIKHREKMVEYFDNCLSNISGVFPIQRTPGTDLRSIYQHCVVIDRSEFSDASIKAISDAISAELSITVELLDTPLYRNKLFCPQKSPLYTTIYKDRAEKACNDLHLSISEEMFSTCISFPHPLFLGHDSDVDDIIDAIIKVKKHSKSLCKERI